MKRSKRARARNRSRRQWRYGDADPDSGCVEYVRGFPGACCRFFVDNLLSRNSDSRGGYGLGYFATVIVCEILFGVLASIIVAWFSRYREYRADAGSARLLHNKQPMIHALMRLGQMESGDLPKNVAMAGINGRSGLAALFASHPPIEKRIEALRSSRV